MRWGIPHLEQGVKVGSQGLGQTGTRRARWIPLRSLRRDGWRWRKQTRARRWLPTWPLAYTCSQISREGPSPVKAFSGEGGTASFNLADLERKWAVDVFKLEVIRWIWEVFGIFTKISCVKLTKQKISRHHQYLIPLIPIQFLIYIF